jgi:phosphopantothenoylcysteine decarboxylase/phosphopantothenate--cysteine ligase
LAKQYQNKQGMGTSSLQGRNILVGITGSIAAFKTAGWVHALTKEGAQVTVVMTESAIRFVSSLTFAALSGNRVYTDMFAQSDGNAMVHINLPRATDVVLIAPATAQTIARLAHGMADDLLSTAVLAASAPVVICPAMNSQMLAHPATQRNLATLQELGYLVVEPATGKLACGDEGAGRLPEWDEVRETLLARFAGDDLKGKQVLITAGPTREAIDPARYLTNRSSGKMGYALARTARRRGAEVVLVSGPVSLDPPPGVTLVPVETGREMQAAVQEYAQQASVVVKAAAVADFRPTAVSAEKIKKATADPCLTLTGNPDILAELGSNRRDGQVLVGFAAESHNHQAEGLRKLKAKNVDLMVVNDILGKDTGFDVDTNRVTLISGNGVKRLELMSKEDTADQIWNSILGLGG